MNCLVWNWYKDAMFLQCQGLRDYSSVNAWLITIIQMEAANMQIYNLHRILTYIKLWVTKSTLW